MRRKMMAPCVATDGDKLLALSDTGRQEVELTVTDGEDFATVTLDVHHSMSLRDFLNEFFEAVDNG